MRILTVLALASAVLLPQPLHGQVVQEHAPAGPGLVTLEFLAAALWLDTPEESSALGGLGARAMLHPFAGAPESGPWYHRLQFGGFLIFTPDQDGLETMHYGAEVDVHLLQARRVRGLDPFVGLGIGGLRVEQALGDAREAVSNLSVVPGVGAHLVLSPRFALRGDLRDVILFDDETTHNLELSAGLTLVFSIPGWAQPDVGPVGAR